ncbi:MAG: hypothetical protein ABIM50_05180 [Novosphingobium sp.]
MQLPLQRLALFGPLLLTACVMLPHPADPQIVSLAKAVEAEAGTFFGELAGKRGPDCSFEANADGYDRLAQRAAALKLEISLGHGSPALVLASDALLRTLVDARASHAEASARIDDVHGACMAPGAIALNAEAVARASAAIAATQTTAGAQ